MKILQGLTLALTLSNTPFPNALSVGELIQKFWATDNYPRGPYDGQYKEQAHWYISGIKDATEGIFWCYRPGEGPADLDNETMHLMKKQAATTMDEDAAKSFIKALATRYPCKPGARHAI